MTLRYARVLAIARRDLALELRARRGLALPLIALFLLAPAALAPVLNVQPVSKHAVRVGGDVPAVVLAHPDIHESPRARIRLERDGDTVLVRADTVPELLREALDAADPTLSSVVLEDEIPLPSRGLILALIAASVLTGVLAVSLPGERNARTLQALLTASVTRGEIVVGKWYAWAGLSSVWALLAAGLAIAVGRIDAGPWLAPMPFVCGGAVALGLWLVRHDPDVVGGATAALRVLPLTMTTLAGGSWLLGRVDPYLGASVPIGGALAAAGEAWPGWGPPLVACASTGAFTAVLLALTARDLDDEDRHDVATDRVSALALGGVCAVAWGTPLVGPLLWRAGGNPGITLALPLDAGVIAAAIGLLLVLLVRVGRSADAVGEFGIGRGEAAEVIPAVVVGVALAITASVSGLIPSPSDPLVAEARVRMAAALNPGWAGMSVLLLSVVAQEALFRGWLRRHLGDGWQVALFVLVCTPLDPVRGLCVAMLLTLLVRRSDGALFPAILARLVWAVLPPLNAGLEPGLALGVVLVLGLWLGGAPRTERFRRFARRSSGVARSSR